MYSSVNHCEWHHIIANCADVPIRIYSLTHFATSLVDQIMGQDKGADRLVHCHAFLVNRIDKLGMWMLTLLLLL